MMKTMVNMIMAIVPPGYSTIDDGHGDDDGDDVDDETNKGGGDNTVCRGIFAYDAFEALLFWMCWSFLFCLSTVPLNNNGIIPGLYVHPSRPSNYHRPVSS